MSKQHKDHRYIEALLENDSRLIREIYTRFSSQIILLIQRNNGDLNDAGDIFQEGLVSITQRAGRGDFVLTCPFGAYLHMVCKSLWLNELKRRKRTGVTYSDDFGFKDVADADALSESTLKAKEQDDFFRKKLEEMSNRCKELIKLSLKINSMKTVAEQLGMTYAYARKKKSECLSKLMKLIKSAPEYQFLKD